MSDEKLLMENAHQKLKASEKLLENEFYADALSRAYYAMFFAARALLSQQNIYPQTHRGLISQFGLELVKNRNFNKDLFNLMVRAQEDREEADYGLYVDISKEETVFIIEGAKNFLKECESFLV